MKYLIFFLISIMLIGCGSESSDTPSTQTEQTTSVEDNTADDTESVADTNTTEEETTDDNVTDTPEIIVEEELTREEIFFNAHGFDMPPIPSSETIEIPPSVE